LLTLSYFGNFHRVLKHSFYLTVFVAKKGRDNLTLAMGVRLKRLESFPAAVVETVMLSAKSHVQGGFLIVAH